MAERSTSTGPGRVVVLVYGVFALAASARAGFQLATQFHEAPVAYLLSAFSAAVYIVATIAFARNARRLALVTVSIELAGVLLIGTLSLVWPAEFPDATVWSTYGIGYGFVPLVLPIVGLLWLRRTRAAQPATSEQ
ncbi:hypothetical protein [Flindersiella endophytica]